VQERQGALSLVEGQLALVLLVFAGLSLSTPADFPLLQGGGLRLDVHLGEHRINAWCGYSGDGNGGRPSSRVASAF
jgi:hypothetical protein